MVISVELVKRAATWIFGTRANITASCQQPPLHSLTQIEGGIGATHRGRDAANRPDTTYDGYYLQKSPDKGTWRLMHWSNSPGAGITQTVRAENLSIEAALPALTALLKEGKKKHGRGFKLDKGPSSLHVVHQRLKAGESFAAPIPRASAERPILPSHSGGRNEGLRQ